MSYTTILYGENDSGGTEEMERIHGDVNRIWVDYDQIPQDLVDAAVALEDKRFWTHAGVDWRRTIASAVNLVIPIYEGTPGGSTITQQVVKNITQDNDFSIARKAKEILRAMKVEKNYSKEADPRGLPEHHLPGQQHRRASRRRPTCTTARMSAS